MQDPLLTIEQLFQQAITHHRAQQWPEAERCYRTVLQTDPHHAKANHNLGILAVQQGNPLQGLSYLKMALETNPANGQYWLSYTEALVGVGRWREAGAVLEQGRRGGLSGPEVARLQTRIDENGQKVSSPRVFSPFIQKNYVLAMQHRQRGALSEAEALLRKILAAEPGHADSWHMLGVMASQKGDHGAAVEMIGRAVSLNQGSAACYANLGAAWFALGHMEQAVVCYRQAVTLDPNFAEAHLNLGNALQATGGLDEAVASYQRALVLKPDFAEVHMNIGNILKEQEKNEAAAMCYQRALTLKPGLALGHFNLGNVFLAQGRLDEAAASYQRALTLKPDFAQAHNNLGNVYKDLGLLEEALASFRRALVHQADFVNAHRNLLATLSYVPTWSEEERFAENCRFEERHARERYAFIRPHGNSRDEERPLRIGYLSSDFCNHPVGNNVLPVLEQHNRRHFAIHYYAHVRRPDGMTERYRRLPDIWRDILEQDDAAVAAMIREDGIDILVSLAGRFDYNRPLVCGYKPAPVQISWHDAATSGLRVMDYLLTDWVMTPRHGVEKFTEQLIRLPSFAAYHPIAGAPAVVPPPCLVSDQAGVTFGSFNNPAKLNDQVLGLWARVLVRIPQGRLVLGYKNYFASSLLRARVERVLQYHGVGLERVVFLSDRVPFQQHLARYGGIDVALDPFPFCGATTTFETLWMGVPVVTLPGDNMMSRYSASLMVRCGLSGLVASSEEHYLDICQQLAADPPLLGRLRAGLRQRFAASPLFDGRRNARHLERIFRVVWRRWCRSSG